MLESVAARHQFRSQNDNGPTGALAPGFLQGNLVILPERWAHDFLRFCCRNRKPCPLLAVGDRGSHRLPDLGEDLDIRTDLPRYRVWEKGEVINTTEDVRSIWREDLVVFVLGCSFSFDAALAAQGIEVRHMALGQNVSMYRTDRPNASAGPFGGKLVVSMRPMTPGDAIQAVQVTARFPAAHGAPLHLGFPEQLGIRDLASPDFGDPVPIHDNELPVFWACGVTTQMAIESARPDFCITHEPGCMLITDIPSHQQEVFDS